MTTNTESGGMSMSTLSRSGTGPTRSSRVVYARGLPTISRISVTLREKMAPCMTCSRVQTRSFDLLFA